MKKSALILILLFPVLLTAQFDFDTRYFTINASSLPEAPQIEFNSSFGNVLSLNKAAEEKPGSFSLGNTPTFAATLSALKMNSANYWQPVDMMNAANASSSRLQTKWDIAPLKSEAYGFTVYSADASSKVKNNVYVEVRGLDLLSPCPPYGICPRCAPYKTRGY